MEIRSDCLLLELFHFVKREMKKFKKILYIIKEEEEWIHKQK